MLLGRTGGEHRWTGFARSTTIASGWTIPTGPSRSTRSSNASFLIAALVCWRLIGDRRDFGARLLTGVLAAIGVGSYLFHTHAQVWALLADVIPIQAFILIYVYLATVRFFALPWWAGARGGRAVRALRLRRPAR